MRNVHIKRSWFKFLIDIHLQYVMPAMKSIGHLQSMAYITLGKTKYIYLFMSPCFLFDTFEKKAKHCKHNLYNQRFSFWIFSTATEVLYNVE